MPDEELTVSQFIAKHVPLGGAVPEDLRPELARLIAKEKAQFPQPDTSKLIEDALINLGIPVTPKAP